jgi:hypothetical protein
VSIHFTELHRRQRGQLLKKRNDSPDRGIVMGFPPHAGIADILMPCLMIQNWRAALAPVPDL